MVFQKPQPFPRSIYENVAYPIRIHGLARNKAERDELVEKAFKGAGLWNEVKDRLNDSGMSLSGGQQQRLCIARALAGEPQLLLMDEPCASLDPVATEVIDQTIEELRQTLPIVIVTHNMEQAKRISQRTAYFHLGEMLEIGNTYNVFNKPKHPKTEGYVTGRFG